MHVGMLASGVVAVAEEEVGLIVTYRHVGGVSHRARHGVAHREPQVVAAVATCCRQQVVVVFGTCSSFQEGGVRIAVWQQRSADMHSVHLVEYRVDGNNICECLSATVLVYGRRRVVVRAKGVVVGRQWHYPGITLFCPQGTVLRVCVVHEESVNAAIAQRCRSFNAWRMWREGQRKGHHHGVGARVAGDAADKGHSVGACTVVVAPAVVVCACLSVAEVPICCLAWFSGAKRCHSVVGYSAHIVEPHGEAAVADANHSVDDGQREACSGKGRNGEHAGCVLGRADIAVVGCLHCRGSKGLFVAQRHRRCRGGVPSVVEACRCCEGVAVYVAAVVGHYVAPHAFQGEIGIAIVRPFVAVVGRQSHVHLLVGIGCQVNAVCRPVFP